MYDDFESLGNKPFEDFDSPGHHMLDLEHWSPRVASRLAAEAGLVLEEDQWLVIYWLREQFRTRGPEWTAREVSRALERDFGESGGQRHLYELFPRGPLFQACRIAGLPLPHGTIDRSFGSVH